MNAEAIALVTEIRAAGGHVSIDAAGKLVVKAPAHLAARLRDHADAVRTVLRAPRRPSDQWYADTDTDGPAELWDIFREICGSPTEPMPVGIAEHLAVQADAGCTYADISASIGRYMRGTPAQPPVAGWRVAFDLTGAERGGRP